MSGTTTKKWLWLNNGLYGENQWSNNNYHTITKNELNGIVKFYCDTVGQTITNMIISLAPLSAYEPYHDGGTAQAPAPLFAVGNAADEFAAVTGVTTANVDVVDIGAVTGTWYKGNRNNDDTGYIYRIAIPNIKSSGYAICKLPLIMPLGLWENLGLNQYGIVNSEFIVCLDCDTTTEAKNLMSGMLLYYELATPTTSTSTPAQISLQAGNNVAIQTDGGRTTPFNITYTGTDQTIPAETTGKYLARINGVDSVVDNVSSIEARGGRDRVIDLTYMFGAGQEPAAAADFYKLFPTWRGYAIPYNKGSLVNFKGTGLKSEGFNLLNLEGRTLGTTSINPGGGQYTSIEEDKYYLGMRPGAYRPDIIVDYTITSNSVSVTASSGYGIAFPVRCIPNMVYRKESMTAISNTNRFELYFYDVNNTYLSTSSYSQKSGQAPANAYWMVVFFGVSGGATRDVATFNNPCVHLQWSGGRNGDYEPYWDYTRPLPTLTYFERGMNGRGTARDEITARQAVTRLIEIDMDDVEWTESDGAWSATIAGIKADTTNIVAENGLKPVVSGTTVTIQSDESPTGKLVYEIANPSTVTFPEEANVTARVSDYGIESVVPVNGYELQTAPFLGIVKYQDNYARAITKLPENYISKESMEGLLALVGQLHNGTVTMTYNNAAGKYVFGFTQNS